MAIDESTSTRREFLQTTLAAGAALGLAEHLLADQEGSGGLPTRRLTRHDGKDVRVSILALGGWHIGKGAQETSEQEAIRVMHAAIDGGMTFFDNAWDYHDGYSEEVMGKGIRDRRDKVFLMTKNCERDYKGSKKDLEESLKRLQTDVIDLWQFHEMVYDNDPDWVFEKGGIRAAVEAVKEGKVRYVGFTGHKDPRIHLKMLGKAYHWASAQMPINVCDWHYRSFQQEVVPVCLEKQVGVIGMKSLGGSPDGQNGRIPSEGLATAQECIRYSLSMPVSSLVVGIRNMKDLEQALAIGRDFEPLGDEKLAELRQRVAAVAGDGRHELFKSSKRFDGPHHRKQHGFALEVG
jgi:aryl-alcohol dehydrogenase-like predicted oxidoreductase